MSQGSLLRRITLHFPRRRAAGAGFGNAADLGAVRAELRIEVGHGRRGLVAVGGLRHLEPAGANVAKIVHEGVVLPLHVFRLAGIYGPGRGPFQKVRDGTARRIVKPGQVFSRIHVADIAQVLEASMARPDPGAVYNLCDDDPAPPEDVIAEAARLLGVAVPAEERFEDAEMTPMARSFYVESKRVRNDRIKAELGVRLLYPDYRAGLKALLEGERPHGDGGSRG